MVYRQDGRASHQRKPVSVVNISPVIGANTGIGAAAVALLCE